MIAADLPLVEGITESSTTELNCTEVDNSFEERIVNEERTIIRIVTKSNKAFRMCACNYITHVHGHIMLL